MEEYDRLLKKIIERRPQLTSQDLENMVGEKLKESPKLSRLGALLLVAESLGIFGSNNDEIKNFEGFTKISMLVGGLNDVSLRVRLLAISPLIRLEGKTFLRMKLGDDTGKVSAIAWDEKAEEVASMNLSPGIVLSIMHAYTRVASDGTVFLNLGRNCVVMPADEDGGIPPIEGFFVSVSDANTSQRGFQDVRGYVLMLGGLRSIMTRSGNIPIREVVLSDGKGDVVIEAWRDKAELLGMMLPGTEVFLTDLLAKGKRLQTTFRTTIARAVRDAVDVERLEDSSKSIMKDLLVKVLDIARLQADALRIFVSDGLSVYRMIGSLPLASSIKIGDVLQVRKAYVYDEDGVKTLIVPEDCVFIAKGVDFEVPESVYVKKVDDVKDELSDVVLEGVLYSKTPLGYVDTRFGKVEKLSFWLRDGDASIFASAWREKAKEMDLIPVGKKVRLRWVRVRRNRFGELEVILERESRIETLD